jgi:hypoxanthine phosphoribosyltransferase
VLINPVNIKTIILKRELLIDRKTILARVKELAAKISSDYAGKEPVFIGILNGAVFFFSDLVMGMSIPCKIDFVRAASYGSGTSSSGTVKLSKDVEIPIAGKHLILVEDIVDTGLTLNRIVKMLKDRGPDSVKICALIDKLERREEQVVIDYCGFEIKEGFLVGYGLDYDEQYRYLPDICVLR